MKRQQMREQILSLVKDYAAEFHAAKPYCEGERISYAGRVYDGEEMANLVDSTLEFWLTAGHFVSEFEQGLADYLGVKYCLSVCSGSAANLIAFMALTSPLLGERQVRRGDEVITVAAGFPTTVSPIVNYGAVPVFVDVTIPQYNIDTEQLESALSPRTKAVMLAHTLGNPFDLRAVKDFCNRHNLWLIEDNCDALGALYKIDGEEQFTGTIGDIGTSSFYPAHHLTMGEGGAVYTDNALLNKIMQSMRDWGRDCVCPPGRDNTCRHRFEGQYGELPLGYDHKYVYSHFGYNVKITEMQAAIGCAQLKKLPDFVAARRKNHQFLLESVKGLTDYFVLPEPEPNSSPSWFGFMLACREGVNREKVVHYLEEHGVQTRMLFAGNLIKHPCFDAMRKSGTGYRALGELPNTERVMRDVFWVGVYPGLTEEKLAYMAKCLRESCAI